MRFRAVEHPPVQPLKVDMIYRGVPHGEQTVAAQPAPALSISDRLRGLVMGRAKNIRRREQSMLARMDEQVGLTAANAARYDSSAPVRQNFGYDRSRSAMS
ncbi:MAG: hypothetical protein F6J97_25310 [Leptolyngbya sp. SIO4C1]|nr:hypothetical protein [Leptolyngbya sp. SIO4C1]